MCLIFYLEFLVMSGELYIKEFKSGKIVSVLKWENF